MRRKAAVVNAARIARKDPLGIFAYCVRLKHKANRAQLDATSWVAPERVPIGWPPVEKVNEVLMKYVTLSASQLVIGDDMRQNFTPRRMNKRQLFGSFRLSCNDVTK
jgi:hypothetical protein